MVGESGQDALDFLLLSGLKFAPAVVQFDGGHRLDIESRSATGLIVDKAAHILAVASLHRNDIAPIAHGDNRLLKGTGVGGRRDQVLEFLLEPTESDADLAAQAREFGAGAIHHRTIIANRAQDLVLDLRQSGQESSLLDQAREADRIQSQQARAQGAGGGEGCGDLQKRLALQHAATGGVPGSVAYIAGTTDRHIRIIIKQGTRLAGESLALPDIADLGGRQQGERQFTRGRKGRMASQLRTNFRKLKGLEGLLCYSHSLNISSVIANGVSIGRTI